MGIELIWDEKVENVVHYRFESGWTWEEFRQTALKEHAWGEAQDGVRYDIIGDLTHASIPTGMPFSNVARLFEQGPRNRRVIVIVGSSLAKAMVSIAGSIYPQMKGRFYAAQTVEQARQLILTLRAETDAESPGGNA